MRYLSAILFACATAYMWHYNGTHTDSKVLLPFMDVLFPARAGDLEALAEVSILGAGALTAGVFALTVLDHVRDARRRSSRDPG